MAAVGSRNSCRVESNRIGRIWTISAVVRRKNLVDTFPRNIYGDHRQVVAGTVFASGVRQRVPPPLLSGETDRLRLSFLGRSHCDLAHIFLQTKQRERGSRRAKEKYVPSGSPKFRVPRTDDGLGIPTALKPFKVGIHATERCNGKEADHEAGHSQSSN